MPIHILPGPGDPSGTIMPQQPFPKAIFGDASTKFGTFYSESNPTYINIESSSKQECKRSILVNSGQPLNDMFKYLPSPPITRLSILESTLKWRHMSPTAPDTLWCHPYFTADPFIMKETPHIYVVGVQPEFDTKLVTEETRDGGKIRSRIVLLPSFAKSGILVMVNIRTLEVRRVNFAVEGMMTADGEDALSGAFLIDCLPNSLTFLQRGKGQNHRIGQNRYGLQTLARTRILWIRSRTNDNTLRWSV